MKSSFTLHDLPQDERPRERLLQHGVDALSIQELLCLILGRGIQGESVVVTAQKLLSQFGSLNNLQQASFEDLTAMKGIGTAKACQLLACFAVGKRVTHQLAGKEMKTDIAGVITLLQQKIGSFAKEHLAVVSLDTRNRMIGMDVIAIGTLNTNLAHPREIFETAIRRHAAKMMISHNHPSGNPEPSDADLVVTERLIEAGKLFDIPIVDHVIVTEKNYYSILAGK